MFCGNDVILPGITMAMLSIFERSQIKSGYHFYVLTMSLTRLNPKYTAIKDEEIEFLDHMVKTYAPDNQVEKIDVSELYEQELAHSPNEGCYCSPYTLLRLLADEIPGLPDKLLYLDADILFVKDMHLLYDIDVSDYEYAAAPDNYGKFLINPHYINAGVLLFNIAMMKENGTFKTARRLINERKFLFADQSALIRATHKRKLLRQRYNDQHHLRKCTIVRHFAKRLYWTPYPHTENIKQWNVKRVHDKLHYHQFDDIYAKYDEVMKNKEMRDA